MKETRTKIFMNRRFASFLVVFLAILSVHGQNTFTGVITSADDGEVIPGANIIIKGTNRGTATDFEGKYSITASSDDILLISYLGFKTIERNVGGQDTFDFSLELDAQQLDDVVVIGYGTSRKSDLTGSLSSVSSKDFEKQPLVRIDQALQGRAAGVQVNQSSGEPGSGFKIRIRGTNSISGDNTPLYVVDGLIVESINSFNVNDISSMEVLKDASATAIYGSRGANGVVLISTKKGRIGPAKVSIDYFSGFSTVAQKLDFLSPAEFAEGVNFAEDAEFFTQEEIASLRVGGGEDWQDRLFDTAYFNNVQLSASGGSNSMDYFISANYNDSEGTIISQDYKRYSLRANLNSKISDKIRVGLNTFISREKFSGVRANLATGLTWDPTTPAFDNEGNYNFVPLKPGVGNGRENPLIEPENSIRENFHDRLVMNGYVNYDIFQNLTLNISGGVDKLNEENNGYLPVLLNNVGNATVESKEISRLQNTNRLTYTWDKSPNHNLKIDAIHEQQVVTRKRQLALASGFFSDQTTYKNLSLGQIQRNDNEIVDEKLQSFLGTY